MRLVNIVVVLMLMCYISVQAGEYDSNIYIYRNDGRFTAFVSGEVDSLRYSRIDLNGMEHEQNVIQEVWTPDSLYRIPLAVIDSISVLTPEIKYSPEVKHLNPDFVPYLRSVDGLTLDFALDLPYNMRINKGDILYYDRFDDLFEDGFAGRVVSVTSNDVITVRCEPVDLTDIFEQYIAVGESSVETLAGQQSMRHNSKGEIDGSVGIDVNIGNVFRETGKLSLKIKATTFITKEKKYLSLDIFPTVHSEVALGSTTPVEKKIEQTIAEIPLSNPFSLLSISGSVKSNLLITAEGRVEGRFTVDFAPRFTFVYDDGKVVASTPKLGNKDPFNFEIAAEARGEVWWQIPICLNIKALGRTWVWSLKSPIGPAISLDFKKNNLDLSRYGMLKEASVNLTLQNQCELTEEVLGKKVREFVIIPKFRLWERQYYFVPEFSDLSLESDSKQITARTTASRSLVMPCKIGFRITDDEDKEVDTFYDESYTGLDPDPASYELSTTFSQRLKPGIKYKVTPLVKLAGVDLPANPEDEIYLDCNISTGEGTATTYSAGLSGSSEVNLKPGTEVGFVYSATNRNPTCDNSPRCQGQMIQDYAFKGGFSGLKPGTTYYYRAYAYYDENYYYGDTQCITTKKNSDRNDDDNFGGDFKTGRKPYTSTGSSFDIEQRKAKIELTFNCVNPATECGYYLEADDKRGSKILSKYYSLGTVTGRQTVELENLVPGTTYRYRSSEKNSLGSAMGQPRTFKTEPSPDPTGSIVDVSDIDMTSATVRCHFENMDKDFDYGIILTDGKWSYSKAVKPDAAGNASIKLNNLIAETGYKVNTFISVDPDEELIVEKSPTSFTTEAPDILGSWLFTVKGVFSAGPNFDLEILSSGRTNCFFGVNYCYWERSGRKIKLKLNNVIGGYESPTYYLFEGEFNEDYTMAKGRAHYIQDAYWLDIYDVLFDAGPFTLKRK